MKQYFTERQVEDHLRLKPGVINRVSSCFLIVYRVPEKDDRQAIDLGLNLKNFTKKVHIPEYVRYVADDTYISHDNADSYHSSSYGRRRWEYSAESVEIIKSYRDKYPDVFEGIY